MLNSDPRSINSVKFLWFILLSIVLSANSKQIVLNQENQKYVLKIDIGNLKINLDPKISLKQKNTWMKSQQCKYCTIISGQPSMSTQKLQSNEVYNNKNYDCSKSCYDNSEEQYGLKCIESRGKCHILKENMVINLNNQNVLKGKLIQINPIDRMSHQNLEDFQTVLIDRIYQTQPNKNQLQQETDKQNFENKQNTQFKSAFLEILKKSGQYNIWGEDSLFDNNILTKDNKHQIMIVDDVGSKALKQQLLEVVPIEIEFEQTMTEFKLSQIKLTEKITLNNPQRQTEDKEFPVLSLIDGFFTLQTQDLLLPTKYYEKLTGYITKTYFSSQKNNCSLKDAKISCQQSIDLSKLEYLQLQLILNGISVGFPLNVLLKNCKGKSCELKIANSDNQAKFKIGTFFLDIFAVQYIESTQNIKLYRLNNQLNRFYDKNQKYKKQNFNIFWWMGSSVFHAIFFVIKLIFYLALFSLVINCLYHWKGIIEWVKKICKKIANKRRKQQGQLFEQDEDLETKDTSKLIKRFKNRKNKIFFEDHSGIFDQNTTQESA